MSAEQLTALATRLRALSTLGPAIAKEAAPLVLGAAQKTAAAGTTPEGHAWAPRKKDGGRALVRAAEALSAHSVGDIVVLVLSGVNVFQQVRRRILPDGGAGIPSHIAAAIRTAATTVLRRST